MSLLALDCPALDRDQLSGCETRLDALENWLLQQITAPLQEQAPAQDRMIHEINRLRLLPPRRLEWLNRLAPVLQTTAAALEQQHPAEQAAILQAQTLQEQLAQGYKRVIQDLLAMRSQLPAPLLARTLLIALHAALFNLTGLIYRACRFSIAAPGNCWAELNLLYRLACQSRLQHKTLASPKPDTCEQQYLLAVLLGLIKAENLQRSELDTLYPWLVQWTENLQTLAVDAPECQFILSENTGWRPVDVQDATLPAANGALGLDTREITTQVRQLLKQDERPLGNRLLQHLLACLDTASTSGNARLETKGDIQLVLGLRSAHFHLNEKKPFESLVAAHNLGKAPKESPFFNKERQDPWATAHDTAENNSTGHTQLVELEANLSTSLEEELDRRYPIHPLKLVNTNANGYSLYWPGAAPAQLRTGELVALKEQASSPWQPGFIRLIREVSGGHQLSVELLGGRLQPCAVKPIIKIGLPVDYLPGFLIPELKVLGVPPSLITPLLPFREGQKVSISTRQGLQRGKLVQLISSPGEFNQFRLEHLEQEGLSLDEYQS